MNDDEHNSDVRLNTTVDAVRDLPIPAGPDVAFQRRLVDQLTTAVDTCVSHQASQRRKAIMHRLTVAAAALLLVSASAVWLIVPSGTRSGSAFARMLVLVGDARTVVFTTLIEMPHGKKQMEGKTMMLEPDWIREEMFEGKDRQPTVLIQNLSQRKSLSLMPTEKKAILRSMAAPGGARPKSFIEQLREIREGSAELLATEKIDGKEARKYRCTHPTAHYLIWIAAGNDLPVRVEMTESAASEKGEVKITLRDFQWNAPLDESLFTLEVPKGYALEKETLPGDELDPTNFLATMKAYVRLNKNEFPDEYNSLSTGAMIKFLDDPSLPEAERQAAAKRKLAEALDHPEWNELSDAERKKKGHEVARMFAQGAVFLQILSQTHEWHYVGKGAKLGQKDRIVAWWAPKAEAKGDQAQQPRKATVVYGDFHTATVPVSDLPRDAK
jgi:uncharacterized protein DUF2092